MTKYANSNRIIFAVIGVMACSSAALYYIGNRAFGEIDVRATKREQRFAVRALLEEMDRLNEQQLSIASGQEALLRVKAADDQWIRKYLGAGMQEYFGHEESYIIAQNGDVLHAALNGVTLPEPKAVVMTDVLSTAISQVREELPPTLLNGFIQSKELDDGARPYFALVDGKVALVSVARIGAGSLERGASNEAPFLHIAIEYADDEMAMRIARSYDLMNANFRVAGREPEGGSATVNLTDTSGFIIGYLSWLPDRPGSRLTETLGLIAVYFMLINIVLLAALCAWLMVAMRRLSRSELKSRLYKDTDRLAKMANRFTFKDELLLALQEEQKGGPSVTVLIIDLDNFKAINDTLGRAAGDELIQLAGARLNRHVRDADTVARLSGDEFGIILRGVRSDLVLTALSSGLISVLSQPYSLSYGAATITSSVGVARSRDVQGGMEPLLRAADAALSEAKRTGRARFCILDAKMNKDLLERHYTQRELQAAVATGKGLTVVYQPILDRSGAVASVEALTRWTTSLGPISPDIFFDVAEENGSIHELGRLALRDACKVAVALDLPKVAVNVSALQLRVASFHGEVRDILVSSGLGAIRLELECTERCALDPCSVTKKNIRKLRSMGVTIALDDFATGKSLLRNASDFQVDIIKIDKSFVQRIAVEDGAERIITMLVGLAKALNLKVVAEGVETQGQYAALHALGCDYFQGFLFARPMKAEDLSAFFSKNAGATLPPPGALMM